MAAGVHLQGEPCQGLIAQAGSERGWRTGHRTPPSGARLGQGAAAAPGEGRRDPSYLFASTARPGAGPGGCGGDLGTLREEQVAAEAALRLQPPRLSLCHGDIIGVLPKHDRYIFL